MPFESGVNRRRLKQRLKVKLFQCYKSEVNHQCPGICSLRSTIFPPIFELGTLFLIRNKIAGTADFRILRAKTIHLLTGGSANDPWCLSRA